MRLLLMWRGAGNPAEDLSPERVAARVQQLFSPLFAVPPCVRTRQGRAMSMVFLEAPVPRWNAPFFQEDRHTWVLAVDYPLNAQAALADQGTPVGTDAVLPALCRQLEAGPRSLLRTIVPPFCLVWSSQDTGETFVQNDGLGQTQLVEFQNDRLWALTNKIVALKALGISLELERDHWAVRSTLGWFPLDMTGYKRLRFLAPATQLRLDSHGLTRTTHEVLSEWVRPAGLSQDDCLELARCSLINQIKAVMPLSERPSVGLSGGWDTRAVVSTLRALGFAFSPRVRGLPGRPDVLVASELARIAGLDLSVHSSSGLPPPDAGACARCISLALLWQAGYMPSHKHKTFLSNKPYLEPGTVNIMGQHGEIGRGYYAKRIRAAESSEPHYESRLISHLMGGMPPFTRQDLQDLIRETIRTAYRQADRYDLVGLARLDFFYLYERTRRWASGSLSAQPGVVVAPFLNPDYIRATFAYSGGGEEANPFHRHIIAVHSPDWLHVPFAEDLKRKECPGQGADPRRAVEPVAPCPVTWRQPEGNRNYNSSLYWATVGRPLIDDALARGGFWTDVFDPDLVEKQWSAAPDDVALLDLLPRVMES